MVEQQLTWQKIIGATRATSVPGQGDLEDLVSRHKGRQSGQGLFAGTSDTDQQSMTTWSPSHT